MRRFVSIACLLAPLAAALPAGNANAWGQEGHSVVAEIAQRRLSPQAAAIVEHLLGRGHSLASVGSWADDARDLRPETYNWHFVSIPRAAASYDPGLHCAAAPKGDCVVAALERLRNQVRCADSYEARRDALRYAVHFIGDIHQPLHTVGDELGGNLLKVQVQWRGLICTGNCVPKKVDTNLHAVWDTSLITSTVWNWGAYVNRLEDGWLKSAAAEAEMRKADGGSPGDWANAAHADGQAAWNRVPADRVLDDGYFQEALPVVDRQLGLAGLRLARFLNEAYSSQACPDAR